ncbi:MAG: hypothetical protein AAGG75_19160 [Bacteroidota bacterium]
MKREDRTVLYIIGIINIVLFFLSEIEWIHLLNNAVYYNLSMTYALVFPLIFIYLIIKLDKKFSLTFITFYSLMGLLMVGLNGWIGYQLVIRSNWEWLLG